MAAARLVRLGHPPDQVMRYTPRQIAGWLHFGEIDHAQQIADQMLIGMAAARGDPKEVERMAEDLRE